MKIYGHRIYEEQFSTKGWGKYPSEEVIRFFIKAKARIKTTNPKALDIGCGIGSCTWFMAKEGASVTAIDGAPSGLKKVKKLADEFGIDNNIITVHGDITKPLTFIKSTFNIMVDSYSLYSNEENYPYMVKIFDSNELGYKKLKVKVFEIDYEKFNNNNE